jgi:hypothetical protein
MIAMMEQPPKETRRSRLMELVDWLLRGPRMQVRIRPICATHNMPMITRKTVNGISYFYCPCSDCNQTWKGKPERIV